MHAVCANEKIATMFSTILQSEGRSLSIKLLHAAGKMQVRRRPLARWVDRHFTQGGMQMRSVNQMPRVGPELLAEFLCWDVVFQLAVVRIVFDHICALDAADVFCHKSHTPEEAIAVGGKVNCRAGFLGELGLFEDVDMMTLLSQCDGRREASNTSACDENVKGSDTWTIGRVLDVAHCDSSWRYWRDARPRVSRRIFDTIYPVGSSQLQQVGKDHQCPVRIWFKRVAHDAQNGTPGAFRQTSHRIFGNSCFSQSPRSTRLFAISRLRPEDPRVPHFFRRALQHWPPAPTFFRWL